LLDLRRRFWVREVRFDPYQLVAVAQRLTAASLPMVEFPQSVPNLTESSTNLFEAIKGSNLRVYPDDEIRLAVNRAVALETSRGWRIAKEKQSHKIDVVVALAMAALGAVQQGQTPSRIEWASAKPHIPRSRFDERPAGGDRLYARGEDVAAAEDRASARLARSWSSRWKGSGF
jgi:phage terminase large subunit-like protein